MLEADYSIEKMPGGMIQKGRTRRAGVGGGKCKSFVYNCSEEKNLYQLSIAP